MSKGFSWHSPWDDTMLGWRARESSYGQTCMGMDGQQGCQDGDVGRGNGVNNEGRMAHELNKRPGTQLRAHVRWSS